MNISLKTIAKLSATSIADAIEKIAQESDTIASGIIGPSFATSGPGSGWSKQFDETDYAKRALADDFGAASYIDSADGREATLDSEGDVEWSDESVVEIEMPSLEDALENPDEFAILAKDAASYGADAEEWEALAERVENYPSREAALERIDGSLINDGEQIVYFDGSTCKYYLGDVDDLDDLRALMADKDEDVARDAYSHWCSGTSHPECDSEGNGISEEIEAA